MAKIVQYTGPSDIRHFSDADLVAAGFPPNTGPIEFNRENEFTISVSDSLATFLVTQGSIEAFDGSSFYDLLTNDDTPGAGSAVLSVDVNGAALEGNVVVPRAGGAGVVDATKALRALGTSAGQAAPGTSLAGKVSTSTFSDDHMVLVVQDDAATPTAVQMDEATMLGRKTGEDIAALDVDEVLGLLSLLVDATTENYGILEPADAADRFIAKIVAYSDGAIDEATAIAMVAGIPEEIYTAPEDSDSVKNLLQSAGQLVETFVVGNIVQQYTDSVTPKIIPVSSFSSVVADTAVVAGKLVTVDTSGGDVTLTFPSPASLVSGSEIVVKITDATNDVTVDPSAGTVDGGATLVLTDVGSTRFISNSAGNWVSC